MKIFLIALLSLSYFNASAQKKAILYYMPDSVEIKLNEFLANQSKSKEFYFVLENINKDTFQISVCSYDRKSKNNLNYWVFSSQRKVVVDSERFPLLLDYDYKFSSPISYPQGTYGDRANHRARVISILHCFNIKFTKNYILDNKNNRIGYANKLISDGEY